jgi:serine/threonine protein kinase
MSGTNDVLAGGRYKIVRRIAQGGMGDVLLTDFPGDQQLAITPGLVVVKRVLADHPNKDHQAAMLREEGRVSLRLLHDNLVETFFIDEHEGDPILVMEFLSGRAMSQVLGQAKKRKELVPVDNALALLRAAACGLHFAHTLSDRGRPLGLIHRDVSPANLFVTFDGRVKVIDFGVAKADDSEIRTSTGILKGKLGYMSPEHALGERLTPAADMWSLGVLFWETLCAERLFSHAAPSATLQAISEKPIPLPTVHRPDLQPHVVDLAMRLLERRLDKRIATGAALVEAIDRLPESSRLPRIDLGGWLSGRFPEEAVQGRQEAARAAKMRRRIPVPIGLVEGTAAPFPTEGDAPTLVIANALDLVPKDLLSGVDEDVATQRITPPVDAAATKKMIVAGHVGNLLADGDSNDSGPVDDGGIDVDLSTSSGQGRTKPLPELNRPREPVRTQTASASGFTGGQSSTLSTTMQGLDRGGSWVAVAFLTFGALALAMGIAFSFLAPRPPVRFVAAYDDGSGQNDVVVAAQDAPPTWRQVNLGAPEVKVGGELKKIEPAVFEQELATSGVLVRASLPATTRGMLAVLLPVLIAGLGLLALAGAVPALVLSSTRLRAIAQVALVLAAALLVAALVKRGALSWPGLDAASNVAKLELAKPATPATATTDR